jgi:glutaredoxin
MQSRPPLTHVVIYSKPGCHLCDEMKAIVDRVRRSTPFDLQVVDISDNEQLDAFYGLEIPVLEVNGKKAAKYRVTEAQFKQLLQGRGGCPERC